MKHFNKIMHFSTKFTAIIIILYFQDQTEKDTSQALMAIDARNLPNILKRVGNLLPIRSGVS